MLIPSPLLDAGTAPNASVTVPLRPPPAVRPSRESQLAEKLGLQPPKGKDAVVELLERFTAEELRLFAEIERRTHQPPSAAVVRWVERRKAGGSVAELKGQVDEVAAGDLLVRAALLRWLEPPQAQAPGLQPPGASGSGGPVPVRPLAPGRPGGQR